MHVEFVDTTLRDGNQSLWAMNMPPGLMAEVAADLDRAGLHAVEVPLNPIFFKKIVRDLKADPWTLARLLGRTLRSTTRSCMGAAAVHLDAPPPPALVRLFYARVAETGGLNRVQVIANTMDQVVRNFYWVIPMFRDLGFKVAVALAYTISPRHTDAYYADKTREVLAFAPDAVYIKDPAGLLTPDRIRTLVPAVVGAAGAVPVELHSHCTTGLAPLCYQEALGLGIRILHTAVPPLANGSSQPSIFNVAANARVRGLTSGLDEAPLQRVSAAIDAFARREGLPVGAPVEYGERQFVHQVPGGVISNLHFQLAELHLQHRLDEVLDEVVRVRTELGYPMMITPYSQFVVTQAAINVALGERYRMVTDEITRFALGNFGRDSGFECMDPDLRDRILGRPRARELAQSRSPEVSLDDIRARYGGAGVDDEELLLRYIMKGAGEVDAMRASGGATMAGDGARPVTTLLRECARLERTRTVYVRKGTDAMLVRRSPRDASQAGAPS